MNDCENSPRFEMSPKIDSNLSMIYIVKHVS